MSGLETGDPRELEKDPENLANPRIDINQPQVH